MSQPIVSSCATGVVATPPAGLAGALGVAAEPASHPPVAALQTSADGVLVPFDLQAGAVYALGLTFSDHIRETGEPAVAPLVFRKRCRPQPGDAMTLQPPTAADLLAEIGELDAALATWLQRRGAALPLLLDYEVEIGIALLQPVSLRQLRQPGCQVRLGLFVANDVTARSVQIGGEAAKDRLAFWSAAKSFAGFLPVGRQLWLPHVADLDHFPRLQLQTYVNGQLRQSACSSQMIYSPRELLYFAAASAPDGVLQANDLILCGTPAGIGLSLPRWKRWLARLLPPRWRVAAALRANRDNPRLLRPGDQVRCCAGWLGQCDISILKS